MKKIAAFCMVLLMSLAPVLRGYAMNDDMVMDDQGDQYVQEWEAILVEELAANSGIDTDDYDSITVTDDCIRLDKMDHGEMESRFIVAYDMKSESYPAANTLMMGFNFMPSNRSIWFPSMYFDGSSLSYSITTSTGKTYPYSINLGSQY